MRGQTLSTSVPHEHRISAAKGRALDLLRRVADAATGEGGLCAALEGQGMALPTLPPEAPGPQFDLPAGPDLTPEILLGSGAGPSPGPQAARQAEMERNTRR